jgi:hypothetical protein
MQRLLWYIDMSLCEPDKTCIYRDFVEDVRLSDCILNIKCDASLCNGSFLLGPGSPYKAAQN